MWGKYFSTKIFTVTDWGQNWPKTRPLLFKIWKFSNSMDSRIVQWLWANVWWKLGMRKRKMKRSLCWRYCRPLFWSVVDSLTNKPEKYTGASFLLRLGLGLSDLTELTQKNNQFCDKKNNFVTAKRTNLWRKETNNFVKKKKTFDGW